MAKLCIKQLTVENWLKADQPSSLFAGVSPDGQIRSIAGDDWARHILQPKLLDSVPDDVQVLYEVARGTMVYGWFFYPLYTLGVEQLSRVAEAAISHKCKMLGAPTAIGTFAKKIQWLAENSIIPESERNRWDSIRRLRNAVSHRESQPILAPGYLIGLLERFTEQINSLFTGT